MWQKGKVQKTWLWIRFFPLRSCLRTFTLTAITIYNAVLSSAFNQGCGSLGSESLNKVSLCPEQRQIIFYNLRQSVNKTGTERSMIAREQEEQN